MPEGDTIRRVARTLSCAIANRELERLALGSVRDRGPLREIELRPHLRIKGVEARGKHLLIAFTDGRTLHSHMGMTGSWHLYRPGEPWRLRERAARAVLETDDAVAVCFMPQTLELLSKPAEEPERIRRLGPDLSDDAPDLEEAVRRLRALRPAGTEIGEALLDQRISAGVGNVYKSETLAACGAHPFASIGDLRDDQILELFVTASALMRRNVGNVMRSTVPGGLAVYGRAGRPCRRCGTTIRSRRQGEHARTTYWCPSCQPSRTRIEAGA
jgi:endonuclease-8